MRNSKKPEEKKSAAATVSTAEKKSPVAKEAVKSAVPEAKTETKTTAKKTAAPKAAKTSAAKTGKAPAKKTAAKSSVKPGAKSAAKSTAKTAPAKRTAAAKTESAPAKRAARKPKTVSLEDICKKLEKMVNKTKVGAVKGTAAVDVKIWDWENEAGQERHLYIELKDGKVSVMPHDYKDSSFNAYISYADAVSVAEGKLKVSDAVMDGKLKSDFNLADVLKIASIF